MVFWMPMPKSRMKIIEIAALIAAGLGLCAVDNPLLKLDGYVIVDFSVVAVYPFRAIWITRL